MSEFGIISDALLNVSQRCTERGSRGSGTPYLARPAYVIAGWALAEVAAEMRRLMREANANALVRDETEQAEPILRGHRDP